MVDGNGRLGPYTPTKIVTKQYPVTTLVAPVNGSIEASTPTFEWTAVIGAASYRLEISNSPTFATLFDSITTNNIQFTPTKLYPNNVYYWRVAIVDKNNRQGPFTNAILILDPTGYGYKSYMPVVKK